MPKYLVTAYDTPEDGHAFKADPHFHDVCIHCGDPESAHEGDK